MSPNPVPGRGPVLRLRFYELRSVPLPRRTVSLLKSTYLLKGVKNLALPEGRRLVLVWCVGDENGPLVNAEAANLFDLVYQNHTFVKQIVRLTIKL